MVKYVVGVDLGGTNIKAGLVRNGKILSKVTIKTQANKGEKAVINNIVKAINSVKTNKVKAVGIGCPGPLNYKTGVILKTPNLPFRNTHLKTILQKRLKLKVKINNDAKCFVLSEALYGAGKGCNTVVGLTLGTGVGGGIVINKKIFYGRLNAGEYGHATINFDGYKSRCGNNGCLETYVNARGILRKAGLKGIRIKSPLELYELANKGNKKAIETFEEIGFYLGVGVTNIILSFDPDIVVLGGNISNSWKFFSKTMKSTIKQRSILKGTNVVKSKMKNGAIIGAASLVS